MLKVNTNYSPQLKKQPMGQVVLTVQSAVEVE